METQGASVVITHHILKDARKQYEDWLDEIGPVCRSSEGIIDWQIIRPIPDLTFTYTVILRFDSEKNLKNWMNSTERKNLIEKAKPFLAKDDDYYINSGLDFLFLSESENLKVPARWKQYFATLTAIYPLTIIIPFLVIPLIRKLNIPQNEYIDSLVISIIIVYLMAYVVMPTYTKLIKKWLFR